MTRPWALARAAGFLLAVAAAERVSPRAVVIALTVGTVALIVGWVIAAAVAVRRWVRGHRRDAEAIALVAFIAWGAHDAATSGGYFPALPAIAAVLAGCAGLAGLAHPAPAPTRGRG